MTDYRGPATLHESPGTATGPWQDVFTLPRRRVLAGAGIAAVGWLAPSLGGPAPRALAAGDVVLVRDGVAEAVVVLPVSPTVEEQQAADELVEHIRLITGVTLPIGGSAAVQVFLGRACPDPMVDLSTARDAFRVVVEPGRIQIRGGVGGGVLYGVLRLLTDLGVRWLDPTWTQAPTRATVGVPVGQIDDEPWWAARTPTALWGYASPLPNGPAQRNEPVAYARRHRLSPTSYSVGGHGLPLVPKANPKTEPWLFIKRKDGTLSPQIDVTHPEALVRVVRGCRELLAQFPERKWLNIGPDDGLGFEKTSWDADDWDPLVGDLSVTDRYVKFFNLVLEQLQADDPEIGIVFFAYVNYMRPPVREVPNPRLVPMFAPITIDRLHSVADRDGFERRYIERLMQQWRALGVEPMNYLYLFNLADPGLPFAPHRQVLHELPRFAELAGRAGMRIEPAPGWGHETPAIHAATALMWDPHQDTDALMADYWTTAYGPAAPAVQAYFSALEQVYADTPWIAGCTYDSHQILTEPVMDRLGGLLRAAEAAAATADTGVIARVGALRIQYDFGHQFLTMMRLWRAGRFAAAQTAYDAALALGQVGAKHVPVAIYPLRAEYQKWFWAKQVTQAKAKTTGENELVAMAPDTWDAVIDNTGGGLTDHYPTSPATDPAGETVGTSGPDGIVTRRLVANGTTWSGQGLRYLFGGGAWYRTSLHVDARFAGRAIRFWIGTVDDTARCWINGHEAPLTAKSAGMAPWEFDGRGLVRPGETNHIVVQVNNLTLDEVGTGGIMGPAFLWAGEPDTTPVREPATPTRPATLTTTWQRARRGIAGLDRIAPTGAGATRLHHLNWQAILDPSGTAVEVGLHEPGLADQHWTGWRTDKIWADQGLGYYQGGIVHRTRLEAVAGQPTRLWVGRGHGTVQAWLDGQPLTAVSGGDGTPWEFVVTGAAAGQVLVIASYAPDADPGTGGITGPVVLH